MVLVFEFPLPTNGVACVALTLRGTRQKVQLTYSNLRRNVAVYGKDVPGLVPILRGVQRVV